MKAKKIFFLCSCALLVCVSLCLPASSFAEEPSSWNIGIKAGVLLPGEVYVSWPGVYVGTDAGLLLGVKAEAMVAPKLSVGFFFQHGSTTLTDYNETANIDTLGGTIKAHFTQAGGIQIRPGIAIGYQTISSSAFSEDISGLDVGGLIEVAFPTEKGKAITAELGFITQPAGGNSDTDVTFGPIFYLTIGYEFGM